MVRREYEPRGSGGGGAAVERPTMFKSEIHHAVQCLERAASATDNPRDLRWVRTILRMTRMLLSRRLQPEPPPAG